MGNRGSQRVRETNYKWLITTYGETCIICNRPPLPGGKLQIDEISYEPAHFDDPLNISLVCGEDNCYLRGQPEEVHRRIIEHHRALRVKARARASEKSNQQRRQGGTMPGVDNEIAREFGRVVKKTGADIPLPDFSIKDILQYLKGSSEMKANAHFYRAYALWVWKELIGHGPLPEKDMLNSGANDTGANQTTLKRYLDGWTSRRGALSRDNSSGEWIIYFKDPAKARRISGKKEAKP
jgi:hypothetical protein